MSVIYEDEYGKDWPFSPEELAGKVMEASLVHENCPYEAQVNVLLTGNEEIHEMNRNFRGIDRPTDVLSFPLLNYETPSDFSRVEEEEADSSGIRRTHAGGYRSLRGQDPGAGRGLWSLDETGICLFGGSQYAPSLWVRPYDRRGSKRNGTAAGGNPSEPFHHKITERG